MVGTLVLSTHVIGPSHIVYCVVVVLVLPPKVKRPRYMDEEGAEPPVCSQQPSERSKDERPLPNVKNVPAYYNWFALLLSDKFEEDLDLNFKLGDLNIIIPEHRLDYIMQRLEYIRCSQSESNEYLIMSWFSRDFDRFLFSDEEVMKGACLGQYPVLGSRRTDVSVLGFKDGKPTNQAARASIVKGVSSFGARGHARAIGPM